MLTPPDRPIIWWTAQFRSLKEEAKYRLATMETQRRRAALLLKIVLVGSVALVVRDFATFTWAGFVGSVVLRGPLTLAVAVLLVLVVRARSARSLDLLLLIFASLLLGFIIALHTTGPELTPSHDAFDVLVIFVVAVAVPNRFLFQALPVIGLGVASLLHGLGEATNGTDRFTVAFVFAGATIVAVLAAWHANVAERQLFTAREEVRTLRGIVPICAECKLIRDDAGEWQQMESFVARRTEAEFSHGLCPSCAAKAMTELDANVD